MISPVTSYILIYWVLPGVVGLVVGVLLFPLLCYLRPPMLVADIIRGLLWKIGVIIDGGITIVEQSNGNYRVIPFDEGPSVPESNRSLMYRLPFGVTYEVDEPGIWNDLAVEPPVEARDYHNNDKYNPDDDGIDIGPVYSSDRVRGGLPGFYDERWPVDGCSWVDLGEVVAEGEHTASRRATEEGRDFGIQEHGGDSSGYSDRTMLVGVVSLSLVGVFIGLLAFPL